jgi:hypothetical protein
MERFTKTNFFLLLKDAFRTERDIDAQVLATEYNEFSRTRLSGNVTFKSKAAYRNALVYTCMELKGLTGRLEKNNAAIFIKKVHELVEKQILAEEIVQRCPYQQQAQLGKLQWTGSVVEWVELIFALYIVKRINNGTISLKELFLQMGEIFDFEIKEFACYFMNIKNRTDGRRTKFTDLLRNAVLERMIDSDRKLTRK